MARQTRSSSGDSAPTFIHLNIHQDPEKEICSFDSAHLSALKTSGIFPKGTMFRLFHREIRSDMVSNEWLCFNAFPFILGLQFPFPDFITEFFRITKISFSQTMPMLCDPLILCATRNEEEWKSKFFFVKRDSTLGGAKYLVEWLRKADFRKLAPPLAGSEKRINTMRLLPEVKRSFNPYPASSSQHSISNMSNASKVPILLDLDKLDSYPIPINVNKETPAVNSSKPVITPKPNPRTRASTSKKRKGSETTTPASKGFSYEELSFTQSLEPMTSFLNKGLQHLLHLYTDACGTTKLYEAKIKQLETTIAVQGTIAEAKTRHYEDKLKKVTHDAEVKLAAVHARIKMGYEALEIGLECPYWPVDSWVAKLKERGGNPKDVGKDAGEDVGEDAGQGCDNPNFKGLSSARYLFRTGVFILGLHCNCCLISVGIGNLCNLSYNPTNLPCQTIKPQNLRHYLYPTKPWGFAMIIMTKH
ncbi:hypothetical protein Hanom_Chr17g01581151 [Helianthus anomalus]